MPEQYGHTLIPEDMDFTPKPQQIVACFTALAKLGSAPLQSRLTVTRPSGRVRSFVNHFTGQTELEAIYELAILESIADLHEVLTGLEHYNVIMSGEGPPRLPPLTLQVHEGRSLHDKQMSHSQMDNHAMICSDWKGSYAFNVTCCRRAELVSTSSVLGKTVKEDEVPFFGQPCTSENRTGVFQNPCTNERIVIANAGCARFWIEFEFGKWLFPKISASLNLLEPAIIEVMESGFATRFIQGCHLYA